MITDREGGGWRGSLVGSATQAFNWIGKIVCRPGCHGICDTAMRQHTSMLQVLLTSQELESHAW